MKETTNDLVQSPDVHSAVLEVYKQVGYVQKERKKGLNYSFAGEAQLIEALRPAMIENGLIAFVSKIHEHKHSNYQTKGGATMNHAVILSEVTFSHIPSKTSFTVMAMGEGADIGDKSFNKAMTGALKYALRQTFLIETGDDPDKYSSDDMERGTDTSANNSNGSMSMAEYKKAVVDICKQKGGRENSELMTTLKAYEPTGNPNAIKDFDKIKELHTILLDM